MAKKKTIDEVMDLRKVADDAFQELTDMNQQIAEAEKAARTFAEEAEAARASGDADSYSDLRRRQRQIEDDMETLEIRRNGLQKDAEAARIAFWSTYTDTHSRTMKALSDEYEAMRQGLFSSFRNMAKEQQEYLELRDRYDSQDGPIPGLRTDDNVLKLPEDAVYFVSSGVCPEDEAGWLMAVMRNGSGMSQDTSKQIAEDTRMRVFMGIPTGKNRLA